jgi:hypothetical protein
MSKKIRINNANILAEQRYLSKKFINEIDVYPVKDPLPKLNPLPKGVSVPIRMSVPEVVPSPKEEPVDPFPKTSTKPIKSTYNVLTDDDKAEISSKLWDKISSNEELKSHLDLQPHHTEHNFLNDISHSIHGHITKNGHVTLEFPGLGKHHNTTLMLGKTLTQHGDSHGEHDTQPTSIPHSSFDFGVKFNLGNLFSGKRHN